MLARKGTFKVERYGRAKYSDCETFMSHMLKKYAAKSGEMETSVQDFVQLIQIHAQLGQPRDDILTVR